MNALALLAAPLFRRMTTAVLIGFFLALAGCAGDTEKIDPTKGWSAEKLYTEGKAALDNKEYEKAIDYYHKLEARFPFGVYAQQAALETVYSYYEKGDRPLALAASNSFIKQYPNSPSLDYIYYVQGKANVLESSYPRFTRFNAAELDPKASVDAFQSFKILSEKFPNSKYAAEAKQKMVELTETLAQYEYNVAQLYYEYGAYVASASRLGQALKEYPQSKQQEPTLALLARSYQQLGLNDLAFDTLRILNRNFPQNPLIEEYRQYAKERAAKSDKAN